MQPISAETILALLGPVFEVYIRLRNSLKAAGATDEQLDAVTADYDARIARRDGEIAAGTQPGS